MRLKKVHCPNCGGMLDLQIDNSCSRVFCPYCGQVYQVDQQRKEIIVTQNVNVTNRHIDDAAVIRAKTEAKQQRGFVVLAVIFFLFVGLMIFGATHQFEISDFFDGINDKMFNDGKIHAGTYYDYNGLSYQAVEAQMRALGFTNIVLINLDDAESKGVADGLIESISVNGDSTFWAEDYYNPTDAVIIRYH